MVVLLLLTPAVCLHVQEKRQGRQSVVQSGKDERRTGDSQVNPPPALTQIQCFLFVCDVYFQQLNKEETLITGTQITVYHLYWGDTDKMTICIYTSGNYYFWKFN